MKKLSLPVVVAIVSVAVVVIGLVFYLQLRGPSGAEVDALIEANQEKMFGKSASQTSNGSKLPVKSDSTTVDSENQENH